MQMAESVALLRALKEINKGTGRITKLLSKVLAAEVKNPQQPSGRLTMMRRRLES